MHTKKTSWIHLCENTCYKGLFYFNLLLDVCKLTLSKKKCRYWGMFFLFNFCWVVHQPVVKTTLLLLQMSLKWQEQDGFSEENFPLAAVDTMYKQNPSGWTDVLKPLWMLPHGWNLHPKVLPGLAGWDVLLGSPLSSSPHQWRTGDVHKNFYDLFC